MNPTPTPAIPWWGELFPCAASGETIPELETFRVLRKRGQPFLVLPLDARLAARGLRLYPGQRLRARVLRSLLGILIRLRLPGPGERCRLPVPRNDPLVKLLGELSGGLPPAFAVLAGNPAEPGRRYVLWVGSSARSAEVVVKIGATEAAGRLIAAEENFLRQIPETIPGVPRLIKSWRSGERSAFAIPFVAGTAPDRVSPPVAQLLQGWLRPDRLVGAREISTWTRLGSVCAGLPTWGDVAQLIEARPFAATVTHGDFTPWNVRVAGAERAQALDWERGEFPGLPAWDWFHFVIQSAILVRRQGGLALQRTCDELLNDENFQGYARAAGLAGRERAMLMAYLFHVTQVLRPTEGLPENQWLLDNLPAQGMNS